MESQPRAVRPDRLTIGALCALLAGVSVGIWLFGIEEPGQISPFGLLIGVLGGASIVGPPLLLRERGRRRSNRRSGPGELLWFSTGVSAWLLWPPVMVRRLAPPRPPRMGDVSTSALCFAYGTPLMALYVGLALLGGGWIRPRKRRRRPRTWRESFGLILGLIWACTGLYSLYLVHHDLK